MNKHTEAVKAAIKLQEYCDSIKRNCFKCSFGASSCPFEFGYPDYSEGDITYFKAKARELDREEKNELNTKNS